jgi:hypothetical protein
MAEVNVVNDDTKIETYRTITLPDGRTVTQSINVLTGDVSVSAGRKKTFGPVSVTVGGEVGTTGAVSKRRPPHHRNIGELSP